VVVARTRHTRAHSTAAGRLRCEHHPPRRTTLNQRAPSVARHPGVGLPVRFSASRRRWRMWKPARAEARSSPSVFKTVYAHYGDYCALGCMRSTHSTFRCTRAIGSFRCHRTGQHPGGEAVRRALLLSDGLRRLAASIDRSRTVVLFGNRLPKHVSGDSEGATPGGRALRFYAFVRLQLERLRRVSEGANVIGSRVRLTAVQNKVAPPLRRTEMNLLCARGFPSPNHRGRSKTSTTPRADATGSRGVAIDPAEHDH
jgi:recA bacterial DNA recombination protein